MFVKKCLNCNKQFQDRSKSKCKKQRITRI